MPLPGLTNPKADVARHRAALKEADGNLAATRECQINQRERFAKGAAQ